MNLFDDVNNMFHDLGEKLKKKFENLPEDHFIKKTVYRLQNKANQLIQKIEKLPENSVIKRTFYKVKGDSKSQPLETDNPNTNQTELLPTPILPHQQKKSLKETMSPEKWEKRKAQIKNNIKKLTIQAGNITTKLMILQTKIAGKAVKWGGRATKLAGYTVRAAALAGKAVSYSFKGVGKALQAVGKPLEAGGRAMAKALMGTKYGAFLAPVGTAIAGLGIGVKGTGVGLDKAGDFGNQVSKSVDTFGKNTVQVGNGITKTGKTMEKAAQRADVIRKHYVQKMMEKTKARIPQTNKPKSNQQSRDNMMRITHPLEYEALHKKSITPKKQMTTSISPVLNMAKNRKQK